MGALLTSLVLASALAPAALALTSALEPTRTPAPAAAPSPTAAPSPAAAPALALIPVPAPVLGPLGAGDVTHVDASLTVEGEVLDVGVGDVDGIPGPELSVAVYDRSVRRRELRVYGLIPSGGRTPEPVLVVPIKSDVLAWCWAEVRDEPGKELVLLTRTGAWAYAPGGDGYRDILRLVQADLLYDVADPGELPRWPYLLPHPDGDALLLPGIDGYAVWSPGGEDGAYVRGPLFEEQRSTGGGGGRRGDREGASVVVASGEIRLTADFSDRLAEDELAMPEPHLVSARASLPAPALVDLNGDGRMDLLRWHDQQLQVYLAGADGLPGEATRSERWQGSLANPAGRRDAELRDLDGDGDLDVLVKLKAEKGDDIKANRDFSLFVLINDGQTLLPETARQMFKFEAAALHADVADVNGDGTPDLAITKLVGPSMLELTTPEGLKVTRGVSVFFGLGDGRFEKRPSLQKEDVYDVSSLEGAITERALKLDLDGDGLADLVDTDLRGNTLVHRTRQESSFFGGDTWELEQTPWRRFEGAADMETTQVLDVNGDGLGDVLSHRGKRLTLLLSHRTGGAR